MGLLPPKDHDREALSVFKERIGKIVVDQGEGYEVVRYQGSEGFDATAYKEVQTAANKAKINWVSVQKANIEYLCACLKGRGVTIRNVLCHGTRNGTEQRFFREATGAEILGTEISDTAMQFPMTIQWDFHEVKPEWVGAYDVVFSNSWDHSHSPKKLFPAWFSCVREGGALVVEWFTIHEETKASPIDPFRAKLSALLAILQELKPRDFQSPEIIEDLPERGKGKVFIVTKRVEVSDRNSSNAPEV